MTLYPQIAPTTVLCIGAVMAIPSHRRPWGVVSWMADVFNLSRVSVYALGDRLQERLSGSSEPTALLTAPTESESGHTVSVTSNRLARTVLTATFPGNVSIRPLQGIMQEVFDQQRSVGWISLARPKPGSLCLPTGRYNTHSNCKGASRQLP